jgi:DNA-directed RNA polymerase specialized sigma subunit
VRAAVERLPYDAVAEAVIALQQASEVLQTVAYDSAAQDIAEAAAQVVTATEAAGRAQGLLVVGATACQVFVNGITGPAPFGAVQSSAKTGIEVPGDIPADAEAALHVVSAQVILASNVAIEHLARLAVLPGHTKYIEALQTYPDDVLCELLRRMVPEADDVLFRRHSGFLFNQARSILGDSHTTLEYDDLLVVGAAAFLRDCRLYMGGKAKLLSYTATASRIEMIRTLHEEGDAINVPRWLHETVLTELHRLDRLREADGRQQLTDEEVAQRFNLPIDGAHAAANKITVQDVRRAEQLMRRMASWEQLAQPGMNSDLPGTVLLQQRPRNPADIVIERAAAAELERAVSQLDERDQSVIRGLFGIGSPKKTGPQLAVEWRTSKQNISIIRRRVLAELRADHPHLAIFLEDD